VSYSGRAELTRAVNVLASRGTGPFSDEDISRALWTVGLPEPDIIIRTGGERRLSGFLAWQSVYAELFFVDTLWPSFSKEEFERVLVQFAARKRNYGV
jgi:undecaprenyl diphosphate synthase